MHALSHHTYSSSVLNFLSLSSELRLRGTVCLQTALLGGAFLAALPAYKSTEMSEVLSCAHVELFLAVQLRVVSLSAECDV